MFLLYMYKRLPPCTTRICEGLKRGAEIFPPLWVLVDLYTTALAFFGLGFFFRPGIFFSLGFGFTLAFCNFVCRA